MVAKLAKIDKCECCNGNDVGMSVYFFGCNIRCPSCFNQELWDLNSGKDFCMEDKKEILENISKPYIKRITWLGGESLLARNLITILNVSEDIKTLYPDKQIWLYTGYKWEDITKSNIPEYTEEDYQNLKQLLFDYIDVLVTEPFEIDKRDITLKWRGSTNQMVIDLKATLHQDNPLNKPILYCE